MRVLVLIGAGAAIATLVACASPADLDEPGVLISRLGGDSCALVIVSADGTPRQHLDKARCVSLPNRSLRVTVAGCAPLVLESFTVSGPIDGFVCTTCSIPRADASQCPLNGVALPDTWAYQ